MQFLAPAHAVIDAVGRRGLTIFLVRPAVAGTSTNTPLPSPYVECEVKSKPFLSKGLEKVTIE